MENMTQAFILLLAGFIVVFVVLILLIVIVSLYSRLIRTVQGSKEKKKRVVEVVKPEETTPAGGEAYIPQSDDGRIPDEIVAVIAAAVDAVYGEKPHRIKAVKKSRSSRSAWAGAGVLENTRPF